MADSKKKKRISQTAKPKGNGIYRYESPEVMFRESPVWSFSEFVNVIHSDELGKRQGEICQRVHIAMQLLQKRAWERTPEVYNMTRKNKGTRLPNIKSKKHTYTKGRVYHVSR